MFVVGMIAITPENFAANLPKYAKGTTVDAARPGRQGQRGDRRLHASIRRCSRSWPASSCSNYIGFQYSAYISGEIRGNIRRGHPVAVLGALVVAVFMNSVYTDFLATRLGVDGQIGWGVLYWLGDPNLPLGQPNSLPLTGTPSRRPGCGRSGRSCRLSVTLFPFLLCPVYVDVPEPDAAGVEPGPPGARSGSGRCPSDCGRRRTPSSRRSSRRASSRRSRTSRSSRRSGWASSRRRTASSTSSRRSGSASSPPA